MLLRGWRKRKKDLKDRGGNPIEFVGIDFNLSREEWLKSQKYKIRKGQE